MDFFESDNFNAEAIAEEAEHLRRVLDMMNEQIALLENDGFAYRVVNFYDENEVEEYRKEKNMHDVRMRDARILRRSLGTPYFARLKLEFCGYALPEDDAPSMTRARSVALPDDYLGDAVDIYVGAHVIIYRDKIIVFSHNSPLGNKVYERFDSGKIEHGGYEYKVVLRRKFDIRNGKLEAVFQDYSAETGGIVYDKFLAHMLRVKRGDKRLTDIIPTIQANQNAIIVRPPDENSVVTGCAGCGKTMLLLQRLEYLGFNKKLELDHAVVVVPGKRYAAHIQPVVDDLMISAARRVTMAELYRELILSLSGVKASVRKALNAQAPVSDERLPDRTVIACYGDELKRKLISSLSAVKQQYKAHLAAYRKKTDEYEEARALDPYGTSLVKPKPPVVAIDLKKLGFVPELGSALTKCKLYLLLTAYCYVLGKPSFDSALFIDEGQDYFFNEYRLIAECTKATVNIYGDTNQQPVAERGIGDFSKLDALWRLERYSLNENYRNAREITEYVNSVLGMNVTSLGLEGGSVERLPMSDLATELGKCGDDRVAVVYSGTDAATERYLRSIVPPELLYTVVQCKGMEYERVFACGKLTDKEKYIAYTRALERLYICE